MTKRATALRSDLRLGTGSLLGVSIANTSLRSTRLRSRRRGILVSRLSAFLGLVALCAAGMIAYAALQGGP